MSEFDLEALKREYAASDERGDAKFTIDFYDMTIVLERLEQAEQLVQINNQAMLEQAQRAEQAEQAVARVRELNQFLPASIMERITRALDGDGRG